MSEFILTLGLTVVLVVLVLWGFMRLGTPTYRINDSNVESLINMVLDGTATESDWDVFIGYPIRYDERLEKIRLKCCEITENEYHPHGEYLFTKRGLQQLKWVLAELENTS